MKIPEIKSDVGVVVARFQVPYLHTGHMELLNFVRSRHRRVLVFLGVPPTRSTFTNPLDFDTRRLMVQAAFPDVTVLIAKDHGSDEFWSKELDNQIAVVVGPGKSVMLYGGRDSFLAHYHGRFPKQALESDTDESGTEVRHEAAICPLPTADFRAGVIYGSRDRWPVVYGTVDVAVLDETGTRILMGRKPDEKEWRFFGGFKDTLSSSDEEDARREVSEEAGIDITDPEYIGSYRVEDWRYKGTGDAIRTSFFKAKKFSGNEKAGDDIAEVRWFDLIRIHAVHIVPSHHILWDALRANLKKGPNPWTT